MPTTSPQERVIDPRLTAISVEGIAKAFKSVPVIHDVNLEIRAGELLALLGPSGSGKTTLLRIIAGLETPDAGRIIFGGTDTTGIPVQKREVGFVFQHYALFKHMTVADNIGYGLRARKRAERPARQVIAKRVGDLLDLIKLSKFADRYPSQLSGGQRQRVALARALAVEPRSTRRCARTCGAGSATSTSAPARPRSSSPTIRTRRSNCPTASPSSMPAGSSRSGRRWRSRTIRRRSRC